MFYRIDTILFKRAVSLITSNKLRNFEFYTNFKRYTIVHLKKFLNHDTDFKFKMKNAELQTRIFNAVIRISQIYGK